MFHTRKTRMRQAVEFCQATALIAVSVFAIMCMMFML